MITLKNIIAVTSIFLLLSSCNNNPEQKEKKDNEQDHDLHTQQSASGNYADSINLGLITEDTLKGSPERTTMETIGKTHLHITYHSPGVKGRIIWGGLVPFNKVWVTGAHSATNLQINGPVMIADKKIDEGTYAIFTIPGEKEWIFILNKNYNQHLADNYTEAEDIVRLKIIPAENRLTQRLNYSIIKTTEKSGKIIIEWEKLKIEIPFTTIQ